MTDTLHYDALIIGGGFYGTAVAAWLAREKGFKVAVVEQEADLLLRASYNNQARVHNGYHYPRDFVTAYRSRINLPLFMRDYPESVVTDFDKVYAIAKRQSKVTVRQFERFCQDIGASLKDLPLHLDGLFNPTLIEKAWLVTEYAFNSRVLQARARAELDELGIKVFCHHKVIGVTDSGACRAVHCDTGRTFTCSWLFNCTYSGLNHLGGDFGRLQTPFKHEITEMGLVETPPELDKVGITVMDGAFFSCMPFPHRQLHTLSHVRYTPHTQWQDNEAVNPYQKLAEYPCPSGVKKMILDVARYVPALSKVVQRDSLFEVKSVLVKNEGNDGRPIVFEPHPHMPNTYSVLGGKIDNIYDILQRVGELFSHA